MTGHRSFPKLSAAPSALLIVVACATALASAPAAAQGPGSPGFVYAQSPQSNPYSPQGMAQGLLFQLKAVRDNYETTRQLCIRELNQTAVDFNIYHCAGGGYALDPVTDFPKTDPKDDAFVEVGQCVGAVNDATGLFQSRSGVVEEACRSAQGRAAQKPNYNLANACWPQLHQSAATADRAFFDYPRSVDAGNRDRAQAAAELRQASDCIKQEVAGNATFDAYMALEAKAMAASLGAWIKALNPQQLAEFLAAATQAGVPQQLLTQLQSSPGPYPATPYNPSPLPPAPYAVPYDPRQVNPSLQKVSEFSNRMRAAAESILQSVGRISKAMTDANDVTKHNNVGIGVAFSGMFGAASQMMGVTASQYQALAAAGHAAGDEAAVVQIANVAVSESQALAGQAEQTVAQLEAAGSQMADAVPAAGSLGHYLEDAVADLTPAPAQSDLPTCTLLSCYRLAQLLGKNVSLFDVLTKYSPEIVFKVTKVINEDGKLVDKVYIEGGGLNVYEIQNLVLQRLGIQTQVGSDLNLLLNDVRAGKPILAYVKTVSMPANIAPVGLPGGPTVPLPLHGVVIESLETKNGVLGAWIYDPGGWRYWQPVATFRKYFANAYVTPL